VPFVTCEDEEAVAAATQPLLGSRVRLAASAEGVTLAPAGAPTNGAAGNGSAANGNGKGGGAGKAAAKPGKVKKVRSVSVIPLEEATVESAGAKAAACGELLRLAAAAASAADPSAASNGGGGGAAVLAAPDGVALPFGCMEAALAADGQKERFADLLRQLDSALAAVAGASGGAASSGLAQLDSVCGEVQGLLRGLRMPQAALQRLAGAFQPGATVIVRSSANVEDLAGMSGGWVVVSVG
jgi:phosphoglucan,water dikinase